MDFSNKFLEHCGELKLAGYSPPLRVGMIVARGFADLGLEAFCMISDQKMVSLFTGEVSPLPEEHEHHFCHVPTVDDLLRELSRRNVVIDSIQQTAHGRTWQVAAKLEGGADAGVFEGVDVISSLMKTLEYFLGKHD